MADAVQFIRPDFLAQQDADSIHARMLAAIPDEFDKSEGGFVWDMTYPTAIEKAHAAQYLLPEAIKCMFPLWASGDMLDMHAANRGMRRRPAQCAECELTFTGADGARVPAGTHASTAATADQAATTFATLAECVLAGGTGSAPARVTLPGRQGNAAAGSICRLDEPVAGVTAVANAQAAQGGVDEESDAQLRGRIVDFDAAQGRNYVGSTADYRRWALEVSGVGAAKVLPASDGSGLVTLIITDAEGGSASEALCREVEEHIMRPDDPESRLAPINALLLVTTPQPLEISVAARVTLAGGASGTQAAAGLARALEEYFAGIDDGAVRLTRVGALLAAQEGVVDYAELTLNGAARNVVFTEMQLPVLAEGGVTLT